VDVNARYFEDVERDLRTSDRASRKDAIHIAA